MSLFLMFVCYSPLATDIIAGAIVGLISARIMSTVNSLLQPISQFCLRLFHFGPYA
jgi:hypothetical protein